MEKEEITIGDTHIILTDLGLDFYVGEKKVCFTNAKGTKELKKFLVKSDNPILYWQ